MNKFKWEIDHPRSADHWLELRDPEGWWAACVKWDGCVHLYHFHNEPLGRDEPIDSADPHPRGRDYVHICEVGEAIVGLKALMGAARDWFGSDWGRL